MANDGILG
jgi:hypothetical protein